MVIDSSYFQPESNKTEDIVAAETAQHFTVRLHCLRNSDFPNNIQLLPKLPKYCR